MITYNDGTMVHGTNLERPRTDVRTAGVLAITNAEIVLALNGESTASVDIRGTFVATAIIEGSYDGINYFQIPMFNPFSEVWLMNYTLPGFAEIPNIAAFRLLRIRLTSFSSGSVSAVLNASLGNGIVFAKPFPTYITATGTAAISTGVSLSIPAPGPGLYQYITRVRISKYCGAVLTPAAVPTIVTSTNISNTPSFDFKTLGSQGDSEVLDIDFTGNPLKALAVNTAITLVAPVLTGAIWKITAFYYVGA
jgi:hypothetical protein